jgi:hypothetical protein
LRGIADQESAFKTTTYQTGACKLLVCRNDLWPTERLSSRKWTGDFAVYHLSGNESHGFVSTKVSFHAPELEYQDDGDQYSFCFHIHDAIIYKSE